MTGLPYFKFSTVEWMSGNITLEDYATQGVFINACAFYWSRAGDVSEAHMRKLFRTAEAQLDALIESGLIDLDGGQVRICFLDAQLDERNARAVINRDNGAKGGRPRKNPEETESVIFGNPSETQTKPTEKGNRIEEKRIEEKRIEEKRIEEKRIEEKKEPPIAPKGARERFVRPTIEEVAAYCIERANGIDPEAFIDHYTANGWRVGKTPMKDWRASVRTWERSRVQQEAELTKAQMVRA